MPHLGHGDQPGAHAARWPISPERALALAEDLDPRRPALEIEALRRHANLMRLIETETRLMERFAAARPGGRPDPGSVLADRRHRPGVAPPRRRAACR